MCRLCWTIMELPQGSLTLHEAGSRALQARTRPVWTVTVLPSPALYWSQVTSM